jgi:hypothetical protein
VLRHSFSALCSSGGPLSSCIADKVELTPHWCKGCCGELCAALALRNRHRLHVPLGGAGCGWSCGSRLRHATLGRRARRARAGFIPHRRQGCPDVLCTWPRLSLLGKSQPFISNAMGVRFSSRMSAIALPCKRSMQDRFFARFCVNQQRLL